MRILLMFILPLLFVGGRFGKQNYDSHLVEPSPQYAVMNYYLNEKGHYVERINKISRRDLQLLDSLLKSCIKRYNLETIDTNYQVLSLNRYSIQIIPVYNKKGHKEYFLSAFCDRLGNGWREELIHVDDGGNCYFSLKINISTKRASEMGVNGYVLILQQPTLVSYV